MDLVSRRIVTETLDYDGGRQVSVYVPPAQPDSIVFAADGGWHISRLSAIVDAANRPSTMIVGVHGLDDNARLDEYSPDPQFDAGRFAAHEKFFVQDVREWVASRFGVQLPSERTAVWGASAGGEFSLTIGFKHPDVYGIVMSASPGGLHPPAEMPSPRPRVYLVGGTEEPWFLANAVRWADALRALGDEVVMMERSGEHGGEFWFEEFPLMVEWAFGDSR